MLVVVAFAASIGGCASWKDDSSLDSILKSREKNKIGSPQRSIVLDVEFVNVDAEAVEPDQAASLWQWVDETPIDVKLRQRFLSNGMRVGVVSNKERFRERLSTIAANHDVIDTFMATASVASDVSRGEKKIPMRIGRRYELPVRKPIEGSHVAMVRIDENTVGQTLENAQYLLAIHPLELTAQKQVHMRMRTEIQHGQMRQKWIGSDSAIRIDQRRETWSIPSLDLDINAREGDVIVIAPTWPITGLAKQMLSGVNADNKAEQIVLLIRVEQIPTAVDQL